jgi:hypothetical protein
MAVLFASAPVALGPGMALGASEKGMPACPRSAERPISSVQGEHLGVIYPSVSAACELAPRSSGSDNRARYGSPRPQLKINGGEVMGTAAQPGEVTLIPIFWVPASTTMSAEYQGGFTAFDTAVADASGQPSNVFGIQSQYTDARGRHLANRFTAGSPIFDAQPFPSTRLSASCQPDAGAVYGDQTGYIACVTDDQIATEIARVTTAGSLPQDRSHLYSMILPKGVEVCFSSRNGAHRGQCTLSGATTDTTGGFCAYHEVGNGASVSSALTYAVIPYAIWNSPLAYSCEGPAEHPSGDPSIDIALSAYSHEVAEAVTDPAGNGWHDVYGNENGDLCNSAYGQISSAGGQGYNQVISSRRFLLQQEFSNAAFKVDPAQGCQSSWTPPDLDLLVDGEAVLRHRMAFIAQASSAYGRVASYAWTVDGAPAVGKVRLSQAFRSTGVHVVGVTVTDVGGWSTTQSVAFSVSRR